MQALIFLEHGADSVCRSTTLVPLVPKCRTSPTPCWTVPTASCCLARLPRALTRSKLVSHSALTLYNPSKLIIRLMTVEMMAETCLLAEAAICYPPLFNEMRALARRPTSTVETVAMSAVAAAIEQNAGAILVMSTSGNTARLVSKYHPPCPIITGELWELNHQ